MWPSTATSGSTSAGWRATTASTTSAPGRRAVERRFYRQLSRLDRHPAGGVLGPDELTDLFATTGYYVFDWEVIAQAYADHVRHGRSADLVKLYRSGNPVGPGADNEFAMYLATQCTDAPWPNSWARQRRDNRRIHRTHPFLTWGNAWFNAPCTYWHAGAGRPVQRRRRAP